MRPVSGVRLDEFHPFADILLQIRQASIQQLLLCRRDRAHLVNLLHAIRAQLNLAREEVDPLVLVQRAVDKGRLHDALLALSGFEQRLGEPGTSHRHAQCSRPGAILGLDDLIATELHPVHEIVQILAAELIPGLAQQRHDRRARMSSHDGDVLIGGIGVLVLRDEAAGAHDVESGDAEEALWVVDAGGFEDLGADWHG